MSELQSAYLDVVFASNLLEHRESKHYMDLVLQQTKERLCAPGRDGAGGVADVAQGSGESLSGYHRDSGGRTLGGRHRRDAHQTDTVKNWMEASRWPQWRAYGLDRPFARKAYRENRRGRNSGRRE